MDAVSVLPDAWVVHAGFASTAAVLFFGPLGAYAVTRVAERQGHRGLPRTLLFVLILSMPINTSVAFERYQASCRTRGHEP